MAGLQIRYEGGGIEKSRKINKLDEMLKHLLTHLLIQILKFPQYKNTFKLI